MTPAAKPLHTALREIRARAAGGEVRLPAFAQGGPGDLTVASRDHLFIIPRSGLAVRAIPRSVGRRIAVLDALAGAAAVVLGATALVVLVSLVRGTNLVPSLLLGGAAALLFVAPILMSHIVAADPMPVDADHPLAHEAASALWAAMGRESSAAPSSFPARPSLGERSGASAPKRRKSPARRATA